MTKVVSPRVFTIGYERATLPDFLRTLQREQITRLIDIRAIPWSRRPEFAQHNLRVSLEAQNISYLHMKALGNPAKTQGNTAESHQSYPQVFLDYLQTPQAQNALGEIKKLIVSAATCLLCYERSAQQCHRSLVTAALGSNIDVIDLVPGNLL